MSQRHLTTATQHRPWPMPSGPWVWHQEWNNLVFMHGRVNVEWLKNLVPLGLEIDTFDGEAWVSVVPFQMQKIRPRFLPHFNPLSDFNEINIRTYVKAGGKPGVYFLSIEGSKKLSCAIAKAISGLPYHYEKITRDAHALTTQYLRFNYEVGNRTLQKTALELWLTERYCLYNNSGAQLSRYEIHHLPWLLNEVTLTDLKLSYPLLADVASGFKAELFHYSPGVQVIAWPAITIKTQS